MRSFIILCIVLGGCEPEYSITMCDDGTACPASRVCVPMGGCEAPVRDCTDLADGTYCEVGDELGTCTAGACEPVPASCNNARTDEGEDCDGAGTTCAALGFAYGDGGACTQCRYELSGCRSLGWQKHPFVPGSEPSAIWARGTTTWVAASDGVYRSDPGASWILVEPGAWYGLAGTSNGTVYAISDDRVTRITEPRKNWTIATPGTITVLPDDSVLVGGIGIVWRLDGEYWVAEALPEAEITSLHAVDGVVFAGSGNPPYLWRRSGASWAPHAVQPGGSVHSITGTAGALSLGTSDGVVRVLDGTRLEPTAVSGDHVITFGTGALAFDAFPPRNGATVLLANDVAIPSPSPMLRAGYWDATTGRFWGANATDIYSHDGSELAVVKSLDIVRMQHIAGGMIATYRNGSQTQLAQYQDQNGTLVTSGSSLIGWVSAGETSRATWSADGNEHWVVTGNGKVLYWNLASGRLFPTQYPALDGVRAIGGTAASTLIAVGDTGTAARFVPNSTATNTDDWISAGDASVIGTTRLNAVFAADDTHVAVGESGAIFQYRAGVWTALPRVTSEELVAVRGIDRDRFLAVGTYGAIVRCHYGACTLDTSPTRTRLHHVDLASMTDAFALGDEILLHYNGTRWSEVDLGGATPRSIVVGRDVVWIGTTTEVGTGRIERLIRVQPW